MKDDLALSTTEAGEPGESERATASAAKPSKTDWASELRGILWLILAVLGFHTFIAKPFYIPSESMLPGLLVGDQLVVSKFPYGWSFVSPTFHVLPFLHGRLLGQLPERGDVVIVTPPGTETDYIKRLIALPGDRIAVRDGIVILNGVPLKRGPLHYVDIPVDTNSPCSESDYFGAKRPAPDGTGYVCHLPIVTETLPNGRRYDTVDLDPDSPGDNYGPIRIPADHVFLMGDNRDRSADSRFPLSQLGLGGPVPYENLGGRAEFITFSLDGDATLNPLTWWGSLRPHRAGLSLHPQQVEQGGR